MSDSAIATDLIGKQVLIGKKSDACLNKRTVRVVYYGVSGLKAVVEDNEGNLEQVNVVEMRICKE